ncbi:MULTISPECIES: helix-turn-helix domain-containing protein [Paraburkholderia]|uniref:helix-turn-helix domain-containing protein n=1 Tax=Paraburkholderia TaxID=1822464 RepID=UPI00037D9352|nr:MULTISPECIES: helix-turn-helix transcriptional regulator [Paraburkholderia]MDH6146890.1 putative transcriptional regulator [Paraburkholderia sp. WSM4179]
MKTRQVDTLPGDVPTPPAIREKRERAGLNLIEAAALLHVNIRLWQKWELGERAMHVAFWEFFAPERD